MQLIPGQELANQLLENLKSKISHTEIQPKLAILQVGEEEPSNVYINKKIKTSSDIGIKTEVFKFSSGQEELLKTKISQLNNDNSVNGIIVQLPTPGTEIFEVLDTINPEKDVDGLTSTNLGKTWYQKPSSLETLLECNSASSAGTMLGATPKAILFALQHIVKTENLSTEKFVTGKNILIINHTILIGKPLAGILANLQATVSIAHSKTKNLEYLLGFADIIITATGQNIINHSNAQYLKSGVVIIDSGFARNNRKSFGDVDVEAVRSKASWLTPVPGGIGPLGVAMLMQNTYQAFILQSQISSQLSQ